LRTQTTSKRKPRAATAYRTEAITVHTWGRLNTKIAHTTAMHANIYSFADVIGKSGVLPASARSLNRQVPKQLKARPLCSFVIGWWKHNALLSRQKQSSDAR